MAVAQMRRRAAGFALVIGVNRHGQTSPLRPDEADVVVNDLAELLTLDRAVPKGRSTDAGESVEAAWRREAGPPTFQKERTHRRAWEANR